MADPKLPPEVVEFQRRYSAIMANEEMDGHPAIFKLAEDAIAYIRKLHDQEPALWMTPESVEYLDEHGGGFLDAVCGRSPCHTVPFYAARRMDKERGRR